MNKTKICHCGHTAHKYYTRRFINKLNMEVIRIFFRCENCLSKHTEDIIPSLDNSKKINILDLI